MGGLGTRQVWRIEQSVFKNRAKEAEGRAFVHAKRMTDRMVGVDWARLTAKEKFIAGLHREWGDGPLTKEERMKVRARASGGGTDRGHKGDARSRKGGACRRERIQLPAPGRFDEGGRLEESLFVVDENVQNAFTLCSGSLYGWLLMYSS